jgi:hypothetical protein
MTLSHRNNYLTTFFLLSIVLLALWGGVLYLAIQNGYWEKVLTPEMNNFLWFINNRSLPIPFRTAFFNLSAILLSSLLSGALIRRSFRKTASPEAFFLSIFCFTLSFESLRILAFAFTDGSQSYVILWFLTKIIYTFRIIALFSLTLSGLFNLDFNYQKYGVLFFFIVLFAAMTSIILPLRTNLLDRSLLYPVFDPTLLGIFFVFFLIVAMIGYFFPTKFQRTRTYLLKGVGVGAMAMGGVFSFFAPSGWIGAILLLGSAWYLSRKIQRDFLLG